MTTCDVLVRALVCAISCSLESPTPTQAISNPSSWTTKLLCVAPRHKTHCLCRHPKLGVDCGKQLPKPIRIKPTQTVTVTTALPVSDETVQQILYCAECRYFGSTELLFEINSHIETLGLPSITVKPYLPLITAENSKLTCNATCCLSRTLRSCLKTITTRSRKICVRIARGMIL